MKNIYSIIYLLLLSTLAYAQDLYIASRQGGTGDAGTLVKWDKTANTTSVLSNISSTNFGVFTPSFTNYFYNVATPNYDDLLTLHSNGKFYGVSIYGGDCDRGSIFEFDPVANTYSTIASFDGANGAFPTQKMCLSSDGFFYGVTREGGLLNRGAIYKFDLATNIITHLYSFTGTSGLPDKPTNYLIEAPNGNLYGSTGTSISSNQYVYEFSKNTNTITAVAAITSTVGKVPSPLFLASSGKMYFNCAQGPTSGGSIVEYDYTTNTITLLQSLTTSTSVIGTAYHSFIEPTPNVLMTSGSVGGTGYGGIFSFNTLTNTYAILEPFPVSFSVGYNTTGKLTKAGINKVYGINLFGGTTGQGVIFEYDYSSDIITKKADITSNPHGYSPIGALALHTNSNLYLINTSSTNSLTPNFIECGKICEYVTGTTTLTPKINLTQFHEGVFPENGMIKASNGKLYGVTSYGGASASLGTIFEFDIATSTRTMLAQFSATTGVTPKLDQNLVEVNGKLYGLTSSTGGTVTSQRGTLYEFDPLTNNITVKVYFDNTTNNSKGNYPLGSLLKAANGKLYGMCAQGGANNAGAIFEYDPTTNTYIKKFDLTASMGNTILNSFVEYSPNILYAITNSFGSSGKVIEYNIATNIATLKLTISDVPAAGLTLASNGKMYFPDLNYGIREYSATTNTVINTSGFGVIGLSGKLTAGSGNKLYGYKNPSLQSIGAPLPGRFFEYDLNASAVTASVSVPCNYGTFFNNEFIIDNSITNSINTITNNIEFDLYPNPSNGVFSIDISLSNEKKSVVITTILGDEIYKKELNEGHSSFDMSNFTKGIYFVTIVNGAYKSVRKLIIN
ncbi:MAG: T9SS type A sorting domain-containing protein [Bacteroidetes bacterium]|nr:T9SS type A sorting domain-containing protein [Bacteroidota bacterium]